MTRSPIEQFVLDNSPRRGPPFISSVGRPKPTPSLARDQVVEILSGPHAHRLAVIYGPGKALNMWIAGFKADFENTKFGIEPGDPVVVYLHWNQLRPIPVAPTPKRAKGH